MERARFAENENFHPRSTSPDSGGGFDGVVVGVLQTVLQMIENGDTYLGVATVESRDVMVSVTVCFI
jgi:hypothetical protein